MAIAMQGESKTASRTEELLTLITGSITTIESNLKSILSQLPITSLNHIQKPQDELEETTELNKSLLHILGRLDDLKDRISI